MNRTLASLCCALALLVLAACSNTAQDDRRSEAARAVVTGTVVDASTGAAVSGVRVEGPHGTHCTSGKNGRFELTGLRSGDSGEITARLGDGRSGRLTLRPLREGSLEVVLALSKP